MHRRRLIAIAAAACGAMLVPRGAAVTSQPRVTWRGSALGAEASLTLLGGDPQRLRRLVDASLAELARLEAIFSLHRADSALSRLNRNGRLAAPPPELLVVLAEARRISALSDGAFDVTVQPLWRLYSEHFARPSAAPEGPQPVSVERARSLVDWQDLDSDRSMARLRRAGMAVTLNGIAQGYITDRIASLLIDGGMARALVDLGEVRVWGDSDRPWRIAVASDERPHPLNVATAALATSAPAGTSFEPSGRFHHLLDPRTGLPAAGPRRVTVVAERALLADALSTALAITPISDGRKLVARVGAQYAVAELAGGRQEVWPGLSAPA